MVKDSAFTEGVMQSHLLDFVDTVFPFNPLWSITHSDFYFFVNCLRHTYFYTRIKYEVK